MNQLRHKVHPLGAGPQFGFHTRSIDDRLAQMRTAADWLLSVGIDYYKTRFGKYLRDYERLNNALQNRSVRQLIDDGNFPELVNSLFEADELIAIYEGLHTMPTEQLSLRMRDFVKGSEFSSAELTKSSSNRGRDVGLELFTASLFARAGYLIDFGTTADLIACDNDSTYIVECKRPQSDDSVHGNVHGAARQISNRLRLFGNVNHAYGIIVISTSKIVNPELKLLVASTEASIESTLRSVSDEFIFRHQRHWLNIDNERIIGVIMLLQTQSVVESRKLLTTCNLLSANNVWASGQSGVDRLKSVAARLKPVLFAGLPGPTTR
jgi:hypothetical protein